MSDKFLNHLLFCLGEECGEVQQVVGKSGRFGIYHLSPRTDKINLLNLKDEVTDLLAIYEMICETLDEPKTLEESEIKKKKEKVMEYYTRMLNGEFKS